jgi:hypothetical protein
MSDKQTFCQTALRVLVAFLAVTFAFFLFGFVLGYYHWIPEAKDSRFMQAVDWGLFMVVVSLILDPFLYFSWISYFKRRA